MAKTFSWITAGIIFFVFLALGTFLSIHKPLWTDEIYTAQAGIEPRSYQQLLKGELTQEANNFPLYYIYQKAVTDLLGYRLTQQWDDTHFIYEQRGQIILRIPSNISVAFALTFLILFFLRSKDPFSAGISSLLLLSSYMTWAYWPEARPYALWYSLSIIHGLLLIKTLREGSSKNILALTLIHWLLAFTSFVSLIQIVLANLLFFHVKERGVKNFFCLNSPLPVIFFYASLGLSTTARLTMNPVGLISLVLPLEWIGVLILCGLIFLWRKDFFTRPQILFTVFFIGLCAGTGGILSLAAIRNSPPPATALYYRHFIFLTPYAVFMVTLVLKHLWQHYRFSRWATINIVLLISGLFVTTALRTAIALCENIIYLF
ncbi:MAG: hypothetical protein WC552_02640 [Candidatus Omnitrophota bacterium]